MTYTPDEARDLLDSELSDPEYQRQFSGPLREAVDDALRWLNQRFSDATGLHIPFGPVLVLLLVVAAIVVVLLLVRPRLQRSPASEPEVRIDAGMAAHELRARAAEHAGRGDHAEAFRDVYRAMARGAEERGLLSPQSGRTATEIALALETIFGAQDGRIRRAADDFSRSLYGGGTLTRDHYEQLAQLDQHLTAAAPAGPSSGPRLVAPQ